jgi:carboxylate-amine ligase
VSEGTGGPPPPHRFGTGEPFSVGLEEELLLVDADTLDLAHVADQVLPGTGLPRERIDHEAFLAELEVRSEPSGSVGEAIGQLAEGRAAAHTAGTTLLAAGLHPDARLFDVELVQSERYERVEAQMQGLIKRTPECALHVHVGLPSPEAAVAAMNGLRQLLPLLHGLGANSPFWFGADSGMASSRAAVIRAYPGRGIPPLLRSWEQYLACLDAVRAGGGPTDHTMVWWDARPQPRLGTVELREVDVQTDLDSAAAIAALARAIMRCAVEEPRAGGVPGVAGEAAPEQALHWSSFRAARDGLDAEIYFEGAPRPLREVAERVVETLDGADPELEGIKRIVRDGNGADRQRAAHKRGGMPGLLRYLADVTARPPGG